MMARLGDWYFLSRFFSVHSDTFKRYRGSPSPALWRFLSSRWMTSINNWIWWPLLSLFTSEIVSASLIRTFATGMCLMKLALLPVARDWPHKVVDNNFSARVHTAHSVLCIKRSCKDVQITYQRHESWFPAHNKLQTHSTFFQHCCFPRQNEKTIVAPDLDDS